MADQAAIEYIHKQRGFGVGDEVIKTNAVRGGFTEAEMDEMFKTLGGIHAPAPPPPLQPHSRVSRTM